MGNPGHKKEFDGIQYGTFWDIWDNMGIRGQRKFTLKTSELLCGVGAFEIGICPPNGHFSRGLHADKPSNFGYSWVCYFQTNPE